MLNQVNTQRSLKVVVKSFRTTADLLSALDSGDVGAIASDDVLVHVPLIGIPHQSLARHQ